MLFAGEMEVDGDLNVSGDIQSPTIAQLQEIIAQLQAQNGDSSIQSKIYQLTFRFLQPVSRMVPPIRVFLLILWVWVMICPEVSKDLD